MDRVEVRLLGPPEVRLDGRPLHFRTRKAVALLAYLTLEAQAHARASLAALLWPDSAPEVARSALRNTITHLRDALGGAAGRLRTTRDTLALVWEAHDTLDVQVLRAGDPDAWRGDFLDGFEAGDAEGFGRWQGAQREGLRALADAAFDRASAARLTPDPAGAADLATRWLALDPDNEAAWRRLILARLGAGQAALARQAYEACSQQLRRELGVAPSPETLALADRLGRASGPDRPPVELPALLVGGRLVGRAAEFGQLVRAYRTAAAHQPGLALLGGEPGIGKTRLAGELLAWAQEQGATVLHGRAVEAGDAAFAPLTEALRRVAARLQLTLEATPLGHLARLIPELGDPAEAPEAGNWVLDALHAAVSTLAAGAPLVLLIDDLQWADTGTLAALRHLALHLAAAPVLLLCTARSEYLALGSPLGAWLAQLRRDLPLTSIEVGALGAADVDQLLAGLVGGAGRAGNRDSQLDGLATWLYATTAGHPLYATETLKALLESSALSIGPAGVQLDQTRLAGVPAGVRAAIGERLARLSPAALALAQGAAVLGQGAAFEVLRDVAGLDDVSALSGYEGLLRAGLLLEIKEADTARAALSHDRVRETLRDDLSAPRRQLLHRRALTALKTQDAPAATLAEHALGGGLTMEAVTFFRRAGQLALRVWADEEALLNLERALSLIPARPEFHQLRLHLLEDITETFLSRSEGYFAAFSDRLCKAAAEAATAGLFAEQAACLTLLADTMRRMSRGVEAKAHALAAHTAAVAAMNPRETARSLILLANLELSNWNWSAAHDHLKRASKSAALLGPDDEDVTTELSVGHATYAAWANGNLLEAQQILTLSSSKIFNYPDKIMKKWLGGNTAGHVIHILLWLTINLGLKNETLNILNKSSSYLHFRVILWLRGYIELRWGTLDDADTFTKASLENLRTINGINPLAYAIRVVCLIKQKRCTEARQNLSIGLSCNLSDDLSSNETYACLMFGEAFVELNHLDDALHEYIRVLATPFLPRVLGALRGIGEIRARRGDGPGAARCFGAVLGHGAAGVLEEQWARATLDDLRRTWPHDVLEAALHDGRTTPLKELVQQVRDEMSASAEPAVPPAEAPRDVSQLN